MRFVNPQSDVAFKKIFGSEDKSEILISFLNAVLDLRGEHEIVEITILNPYQAPIIKGLKGSILDVRAIDKRGVTFIVEMQLERQGHFGKRVLYYASKAYVSQIKSGEDYPKLKPVIFIGILNFSIFDGSDYISRHLILNKKTFEQELKDIEFNFIELPKFTKSEEELASTIDKWVYFLKHTKDLEVIPKQLSTPKELKEAFEIAEQHNWTEEELDLYDYWELKDASHIDALETARKEGKEEGKEEGRKEGRKEERIEIAQKLLSLNIDIEKIIQATGLSKGEIEKLRADENL